MQRILSNYIDSIKTYIHDEAKVGKALQAATPLLMAQPIDARREWLMLNVAPIVAKAYGCTVYQGRKGGIAFEGDKKEAARSKFRFVTFGLLGGTRKPGSQTRDVVAALAARFESLTGHEKNRFLRMVGLK